MAVGGANRGSAPDVAREQQQQQQQLVQQKEKERNSDPVREPAPARDKQPGEDMEMFYPCHVCAVIFLSLSLSIVAVKPSRKSNCVKEVERLKKNREERRFVAIFIFA